MATRAAGGFPFPRLPQDGDPALFVSLVPALWNLVHPGRLVRERDAQPVTQEELNLLHDTCFSISMHLAQKLNPQLFNLEMPSGTIEFRARDTLESVFTIWSGGNDVIYYVESGTAVTAQQICDNIAAAITSLYNQGGRFFIVPNLPPLGDKPNYRGTKYQEKANNFVNTYNPLLQTRLMQLRQQLTGITIIPFDAYKVFLALIMNPSRYGLTNVKDPAFTPNYNPLKKYGSVVPNPDQYFFWDQTHPTRVGHEIIAQSLEDVVTATFGLPLAEARSSAALVAGSGW